MEKPVYFTVISLPVDKSRKTTSHLNHLYFLVFPIQNAQLLLIYPAKPSYQNQIQYLITPRACSSPKYQLYGCWY